MTDEEYTRLSNLVSATIEQQAQFSEDLRKSEARWQRTEDGIRKLLAIAEIHESEIGELREVGKATDERLRALSDAGSATDERLNVLINTVERQISERNGKG